MIDSLESAVLAVAVLAEAVAGGVALVKSMRLNGRQKHTYLLF